MKIRPRAFCIPIYHEWFDRLCTDNIALLYRKVLKICFISTSTGNIKYQSNKISMISNSLYDKMNQSQKIDINVSQGIAGHNN